MGGIALVDSSFPSGLLQETFISYMSLGIRAAPCAITVSLFRWGGSYKRWTGKLHVFCSAPHRRCIDV